MSKQRKHRLDLVIEYDDARGLAHSLELAKTIAQSEVDGYVSRSGSLKMAKGRPIQPLLRFEVNLGVLCVVAQSKMNYGENATLKNDLYE